MPSWSREQSQAKGGLRAQFTQPKVKCLGNLQPLSDKEKAYNKRKLRELLRGPEEVKRVRPFNGPVRADWKPSKRRGANCCRLSDAKREAIRVALDSRQQLRSAFFASLETNGSEG